MMYLVLVTAATVLSVTLMGNEFLAQRTPYNEQSREITANRAQAQAFAFVSRLYLRANPGASGKITATTIVQSASTPQSLRTARIPAYWFIKVGAEGAALCTDIDAHSIDTNHDAMAAAVGAGARFEHKDTPACS